jgi:hypothetical protein
MADPADDPAMERKQLASTIGGGLVILLGVILLLDRLLAGGVRLFSWPLLVLGVGAALFLGGIGGSATGLVIPGTIVAGIGGILFWQNLTGRWFSWAYVWTLIPGFVGLGLVVFNRLAAVRSIGVRETGRWLLIGSGALFLIFATFLGPFGWFWIVLGLGLIALGVVLVLRNLRPREPSGG